MLQKLKLQSYKCLDLWTIKFYCMTCSVNRQDQPNPVLWLDTWMRKIMLSCPLVTTLGIPQEKFPWKPLNKSLIDHACLVKMAGCWPFSFFFFCRFLNFHFILVLLHVDIDVQKILGQYQAILTSHMVNNPYILWSNIDIQSDVLHTCAVVILIYYE